jgi:hypothetical protein
MKYVGAPQYARLLDAREYFEQHGFKFVDAPWAVSREAVLATRPPWVTGEPFSFAAGGALQFPVASAEQSFLQMQMDAVAEGARFKYVDTPWTERITGSFCALTPCFRNEPVLDDLHQPYFMKLELITWDGNEADMSRMIQLARIWYESEHPGDHPGDDLQIRVVENNDSDHLSVTQAYDIVTAYTGIELGSYGIREHAKVGRWVYGTGLAEPRYSVALEAEKKSKTAAGRPS